jgi:hypothetical protein
MSPGISFPESSWVGTRISFSPKGVKKNYKQLNNPKYCDAF